MGISLRTYREDYETLRQACAVKGPRLIGGSVLLAQYPFISSGSQVFPSDRQYYAPRLSGSPLNLNQTLFAGDLDQLIQQSDSHIEENTHFTYPLLRPSSSQTVKGLIILLHGLNEKDWLKYLPWAQRLVELTGRAVLLFPLAFHINRAAPAWHDARAMQKASQKRVALFTGLEASSFTNAAMSTRLHFAPARFFLSGLATYTDVVHLVQSLRQGELLWADPAASVDFLGYSAGAFLAQVLLMANRQGLFSQSKALLFCGGPLLSRMRLTSRYIMDSEAHRAIQEFYLENFDKKIKEDAQLKQLFEQAQRGGAFFRSLLSEHYPEGNQLRQNRLAELRTQLLALTLAQDEVMTPEEVGASLRDAEGHMLVPMEVFDFDFPYSHVNPFPNTPRHEEAVSLAFSRVMSRIAEFFTPLL